MERREFFKRLGAGVAVTAIAPAALATQKPKPAVRVAVNIDAISDFPGITAAEIIRIYNETGVLIYDGKVENPLVVIDGELKTVDVSKLK